MVALRRCSVLTTGFLTLIAGSCALAQGMGGGMGGGTGGGMTAASDLYTPGTSRCLVDVAEANSANSQAEYEAAYAAYQTALEAGDIGEAVEKSGEAFRLGQQVFGEIHESTATLAHNYARLLDREGFQARANQMFGCLGEINFGLYGQNTVHNIPALVGLGSTLPAAQYQARAGFFHRAINIQLASAPEDSLGYASLAAEVGGLLSDHPSGRRDAIQILEPALAMLEQDYGEDSEHLVPTLMSLGKAHAELGDSRDQRRHYDRALDILEDEFPDDRERYAELSIQVAREIRVFSRTNNGLRYVRDAYEIYHEDFGQDHEKSAFAALSVGEYEMARQRFGSAEEYLIEAVDFYTGKSAYSQRELFARILLVESYERRGESDLATPHAVAIGRISPWSSVQNLQPVVQFAPSYPTAALRARREGWVVVEYTVDEMGRVKNPIIINSAGPTSFHEPSLEAALKFRYSPRFIDGEAVATPGVRNMINFNIAR